MADIPASDAFDLCMTAFDINAIDDMGCEWEWHRKGEFRAPYWTRSRAGREQRITVFTSGDQPRYELNSQGVRHLPTGILREALEAADATV